MAIEHDQVETLAEHALQCHKVQYDEVLIHFVNGEMIKKLHKKHFDDPTFTDCITLPIDDPGPDCEILGEVFVCPEAALLYAKKHKLCPYRECTLYIVHGILHLLGYNDLEEPDILKMRAAEQELMDALTAQNLILTPPT